LKARTVYDFLLVLNSNLVLSCCVSEILEVLYTESRFFDTRPLFRPKFQGVAFGVDPRYWGLRRANIPS